MNLKRLIVTGSAIALMLTSAAPALADHNNNGNGNGSTTNTAFVTNSSYAGANTGNNYQGNSLTVKKAGADDVTVNGSNTLRTGKANANASAVVVANNQVGCGCEEDSKVKNTAFVRNGAEADANSGWNMQGNSASVKKAHVDDTTVGGNNTTTTGKAKSNARSWVLVNNQVSGL